MLQFVLYIVWFAGKDCVRLGVEEVLKKTGKLVFLRNSLLGCNIS